jgi:chromosomal replication initiation ATPase DnaA
MFHSAVVFPTAPPPALPQAERARLDVPPLADIIATAIAAEGGTLAEVLTPNRNRAATRARQAAMWLAFKTTSHSLQAIGRAVGRHHTTVLYGIQAYERHLAENATARQRSDCLLAQFVEQHKQEGILQ